ncbi:hypothetical protein SAMN05216262_12910 [Colwellia chukchiensis]|uniref:Uncharacterized protein n=1 Tax=Colwellia chukchiensis TaxID=641665 RepID=A0A1H7TUI5_9GAMM|nr:hypothetical protein [Colwellia chukchiensis]SEL88401.1 hypothetical protein SAMN05216262_12910 [Colwellia chukchiensis]
MKKYFLLTLLLFTIMACTKTVEVPLDQEITVYLSTDSKARVVLNAESAQYQLLKSWLNDNKDNWLSTSGRYAGGIYLTSAGYGIQVTDSKVVLYTDIAENPTAIYAQEIERTELKALKLLAQP